MKKKTKKYENGGKIDPPKKEDVVYTGGNLPEFTVIAQKKENSESANNYKADFYSRGIFRIKDAPKKILGQKFDSFDEILDSTRSGILYLSETVSKISYKKPDKLKEVARLRLSFPEATLQELVACNEHKISKSGINHRLRKLEEIAISLTKDEINEKGKNE